MSDTTPNLALPFLSPSQAQKHVTHNEALLLLDALAQLSVIDRRSAPPEAPAEGERRLVAAPGEGAFAGHVGRIALFSAGDWLFLEPQAGWLAYVAAESAMLVHDGAGWSELKPRVADRLGINTAAAGANRLAVASAAALFTHAGADSRLVVNKAASADTASLLFQTGYLGHAEMGLSGSDAFQVKVSADGAAWRDAITVLPATGFVGIGTATPEGPLHILRANMSVVHERVDNASGAVSTMTRKARGAPEAKTAVIEGDALQSYATQAHDGAAYVSCANLRVMVDGPVGAGSVPTRVEFWTSAPGAPQAEKMRLTRDGQLGIGTSLPTCRLDVAGPARVGQYAKAALPGAAACGAGALLYVSDETGGPVLAFSDGAAWRRVTDRAVVA